MTNFCWQILFKKLQVMIIKSKPVSNGLGLHTDIHKTKNWSQV